MKRLNLLWAVLVTSCAGILGSPLMEELESHYSVKPLGTMGVSHLAHYVELPAQRLVSKIVIICKGKVSRADVYVRVGMTNLSQDWKLVKSVNTSLDRPVSVVIGQTCDLIRVIEKTNKQQRYEEFRRRNLGDGLQKWSSIKEIQAFGPAVKIDSDVSDKEMDTNPSEDELDMLLKQ